MGRNNSVLCYTRQPIDNVLYDAKLAYSMHLAYCEDQRTYHPLNHNSGVLFAKATENEDGSLNPMSLKHPFLFYHKDGSFGVLAVRIPGDGGQDESSRGSVLYCTSDDLLIYHEKGLIKLCEEYVERVSCSYQKELDSYVIRFCTGNGECYELATKEIGEANPSAAKVTDSFETDTFADAELGKIEGVVPENRLFVEDGVLDYVKKKLLTPENNGMEFPASVTVSSREELEALYATASYTDGTSVKRRVDWELSGVDFTKEGEYEISGRVMQKHFAFPVALSHADPCITRWNGKYYFIATNDADREHTLYVREADTMQGLVEAKEHLILDSTTYEGIGGLLWAPEFHEIGGRLYIFHAATPGEFFYEESHLMTLREGGNPACREDWSAPRRIVKKDGSDLCEAGKTISLDMTCFFWEGAWYVIWSEREFLPKDLGAWLKIARLNPKEPWKLMTDPVVLSKPDYGWGNNHTFVEEGPFALESRGKLYVTFSAAAVDTSYVVSYLVIEPGKDLLTASNWRKNNYPILTSRSVAGEYGTGHNAYVTDEDGMVWNTYHARQGTDGVRSSGIRRVHFDIDGAPMLDVTEELDVRDEYRNVTTKLVVKH